MDSFELVCSNISVSKKSIEDSSTELIVPVHVLCCFPEVLGSTHDLAHIAFLVIVLGISSRRDHAHITFLVIVLGISHYCPFFQISFLLS
jgi:hypothetical protein